MAWMMPMSINSVSEKKNIKYVDLSARLSTLPYRLNTGLNSFSYLAKKRELM